MWDALKLRWCFVSYFVAAVGLCMPTPAAAQNLGDVVRESGTEWLIGDWSEIGNASTNVGFHWELDRHAIVVKFASGNTKAFGLITYRTKENTVHYVSADNRGASGKGRWVMTDGHPTLFYEQTATSGKVTSAGFVHKKVDDTTMIIEVYELTEDGELEPSPLASPKFRRGSS